jgi:DNA-binding GntR family transcriptional regulator
MTRLRAQEWSDEIQTFSPLPLHHQLSEILVSHLSQGGVSVGDVLPREQDLADHFQISRNTVRRAYAELEADGWIERKAGRGTTLIRKPLSVMSICLINPELGLDQILELFNDSVVRRCLKTGSSVPPDVVAFLDTQELTTIEEEGLVGGRRVGMCTWWIRTTALQESDVSIIDISAPLNESSPEEEDVAFRRYGNRQSGLRQRLSPASTTTLVVSRRANRHEAKAFGLAVRAPLLEVHDQLENADGIPIAYGITTWQADRIALQLDSHPTSAA